MLQMLCSERMQIRKLSIFWYLTQNDPKRVLSNCSSEWKQDQLQPNVLHEWFLQRISTGLCT